MTRKIRPLQNRLVCRVHEAPAMTKGGLHLPSNARVTSTDAEVLAVGPDVKQIEPHDRIMFAQHAGTKTELDGETYLILRNTDVLGVYL